MQTPPPARPTDRSRDLHEMEVTPMVVIAPLARDGSDRMRTITTIRRRTVAFGRMAHILFGGPASLARGWGADVILTCVLLRWLCSSLNVDVSANQKQELTPIRVVE